MKKLEYYSEKTFEKEIVEFPDEMYEVIESIHDDFKDELLSKCSPIIVRNDKKSLCFVINLGDKEKDRLSYEMGKNSYRITVEKINED